MNAAEVIAKFHAANPVAFLATSHDGKGRVRPMSPVHIEGTTVWIASGTSSEKMDEIRAHPDVELCYMDGDHNHLRLRGRIELCEDADAKRRMWDQYPMLSKYFASPTDPEYGLMKLPVTEAMVMESMKYEYETLEL